MAFFGTTLDARLDEVPPLPCAREYVKKLAWDDYSGNSLDFDAKEVSTTSWRHFGLSWHDYIDRVIMASPFRRDGCVLEQIKQLGPPRSINAIRRMFKLGDSRSRRIFFQIFYAPRLVEKTDIALPRTLILIDSYKNKKQYAPVPRSMIPALEVTNYYTDMGIQQNLMDGRTQQNYNQGLSFPSSYNGSTSWNLQRTPIDINNKVENLIMNVAPINVYPNMLLPGTALIRPSSYRTNSVVGRPLIITRKNNNARVIEAIEAARYPMPYRSLATPTIFRPQSTYRQSNQTS